MFGTWTFQIASDQRSELFKPYIIRNGARAEKIDFELENKFYMLCWFSINLVKLFVIKSALLLQSAPKVDRRKITEQHRQSQQLK